MFSTNRKGLVYRLIYHFYLNVAVKLLPVFFKLCAYVQKNGQAESVCVIA